MYGKIREHLLQELKSIDESGLFKRENLIVSPQGAEVTLSGGIKVLNFCANNYLGLSSHPALIDAARKALDQHGFGMSSVRFICGTTDLHKTLEDKISSFFGTDDTILYAACFDANGGLFEPILSEQDAIISDALNHASIIDGVRLCKAQRYRYANADMDELEERLAEAQKQRFRIIASDAVFSMDGNVAPVDTICALARQYDALVMIDECHSAGVIGQTGRGVTELFNLRGEVDIITGTLGKAFGGAMGGFTTGRKEIISLLRQRSRPYLFSNSLPPMIAAAGIKMFEMMDETSELQEKLHFNTTYFRNRILAAGFTIKPSQSAIVAIMTYDAQLSQDFAARLLELGIYVKGFFYPVVPRGEARIRVQLSAAHTKEQLDQAIEAFTIAGKELKVIG